MAARLKDINPDVRVNCRKMFYLPTTADEVDLSVYDFVVDAVDTIAAKLELARRCEQGGIRFISSMGAGNKLDPSCLRIADITKTSVCPLARAIRSNRCIRLSSQLRKRAAAARIFPAAPRLCRARWGC